MYLNFQEISKIPFQRVLDWLEVPYTPTQDGKLTGKGFIVSISKNLYFNPTGEDKGSIINFVANYRDMSLKEAAALIYNEFMVPTEIPEYDLVYCDWLKTQGVSEETAKALEIGLVKNHKGPAAGKIAFKIRDYKGDKVGYSILNPNTLNYFYFKGYKHDHIYNLHNITAKTAYLFPCPMSVAVALSCGITESVGLTHANVSDLQLTHLSLKYRNVIFYHHQEQHIDRVVNRLSTKLFAHGFTRHKLEQLSNADWQNLHK